MAVEHLRLAIRTEGLNFQFDVTVTNIYLRVNGHTRLVATLLDGAGLAIWPTVKTVFPWLSLGRTPLLEKFGASFRRPQRLTPDRSRALLAGVAANSGESVGLGVRPDFLSQLGEIVAGEFRWFLALSKF